MENIAIGSVFEQLKILQSNLNEISENVREGVGGVGGVGNITNVRAGTGLTGGGSSGAVTLNLQNTSVVAGTYGNETNNVKLTIDAQGRITDAIAVSIAVGAGSSENINTFYSWGNHADQGYLTDAHPAFNVTNTKIANWDTAYSWGDHSLQGYLTDAHPVFNVTSQNIADWNASTNTFDDSINLAAAAYSWGNHADQGYLTDAHPVFNVTHDKIANWDTAYSWGDHSLQGYLTDAHPAFNVTHNKIANWDTAYSWGNHADQGYLTDSHPAHAITSAQIANWDNSGSSGGSGDSGGISARAETWGFISGVADWKESHGGNTPTYSVAPSSLTGEAFNLGQAGGGTGYYVEPPLPTSWEIDWAGRNAATAETYTSLLEVTPNLEGGTFKFKSEGLYMINFDFLAKGYYDSLLKICILTKTDSTDGYKEVYSGQVEFKGSDPAPHYAWDRDNRKHIRGSYIFHVDNPDVCRFKLGTKFNGGMAAEGYGLDEGLAGRYYGLITEHVEGTDDDRYGTRAGPDATASPETYAYRGYPCSITVIKLS